MDSTLIVGRCGAHRVELRSHVHTLPGNLPAVLRANSPCHQLWTALHGVCTGRISGAARLWMDQGRNGDLFRSLPFGGSHGHHISAHYCLHEGTSSQARFEMRRGEDEGALILSLSCRPQIRMWNSYLDAV